MDDDRSRPREENRLTHAPESGCLVPDPGESSGASSGATPRHRPPQKGTYLEMDRMTDVQDQAPVAGAARPCAYRFGDARLGSTAIGISSFDRPWNVTKLMTRRLGMCVT
jgi:hypothetical protein